jgi:hypothetical protein
MSKNLKRLISFLALILVTSIIFFNFSYESKASNYSAFPNPFLDTLTLPANPAPNNGGSPGWAMFFDLIAGSQDITATQMSTASNAPASGNFTVEVFTRSGTALGSPGTSTAGWTSLGIVPVVQGPTANGISLVFTVPPISIDASDTVGVALQFIGAGPRYFGTGTPPYGVFSDTNLTLITGDARSAPFTSGGSYFHSRGLCGVIRYVVNTGPPPVPQYFNYDENGTSNSFPFNQGPGKRIQTLIKPGDFNQPNSAPSGNITHFYCRITTYGLGPATYSGFNIKFGQTTVLVLPTSFIPLTDTVYYRSSVTLTAAASTWLAFTLDTPYEYDSTKSLVIEIEQCGVTGTFSGYSLAHHTGMPITGNGRSYSTTATCTAPYSGLTTGRVVNCGVNITPISGITPVLNIIPDQFNLSQNYPNPFNPTTTINFKIPSKGLVVLKVYDILGKEVATLVNETKNEGSYNVDFNGTNLSSGSYFYKIEVGDFVDIKKMLLVK